MDKKKGNPEVNDGTMMPPKESRETGRRKPVITIEPFAKFVYDPEMDDRLKYIEGLNMWFMTAGNPVLTALTKYCYAKEAHWYEAVEALLAKALKEEGFLE